MYFLVQLPVNIGHSIHGEAVNTDVGNTRKVSSAWIAESNLAARTLEGHGKLFLVAFHFTRSFMSFVWISKHPHDLTATFCTTKTASSIIGHAQHIHLIPVVELYIAQVNLFARVSVRLVQIHALDGGVVAFSPPTISSSIPFRVVT